MDFLYIFNVLNLSILAETTDKALKPVLYAINVAHECTYKKAISLYKQDLCPNEYYLTKTHNCDFNLPFLSLPNYYIFFGTFQEMV